MYSRWVPVVHCTTVNQLQLLQLLLFTSPVLGTGFWDPVLGSSFRIRFLGTGFWEPVFGNLFLGSSFYDPVSSIEYIVSLVVLEYRVSLT